MEKRIHLIDVLRSGVQIFEPLRHASSDTEVQIMPSALEAAKPLSPTNSHSLPTGVAPRGLSRVQAAEYIGPGPISGPAAVRSDRPAGAAVRLRIMFGM